MIARGKIAARSGVISVVFGIACAGPQVAEAPLGAATSAQERHVRFLTTHDLHGALTPRVYDWSAGRPVGGVAILKTMMDAAAAECRCTTFRLDGGDQMQGTLESNLVLGSSSNATESDSAS